jgi:hypothetical protein
VDEFLDKGEHRRRGHILGRILSKPILIYT